jgi:ABC-type glutathione transport system ATPase component
MHGDLLYTLAKRLEAGAHDIEFMKRICTRILFIRDGEIVEDLSSGQKEKIVRLLRGEE